MSGVFSFDQVANELAEVIRSGDAALVLGAGASVSSGALTSRALVDEMREQFRNALIDDRSSFLDAGSEVVNTPPYNRLQLVRFIQDRFTALEPSAEYKQLPRGRWRALFTTNYDDLIEKAYQSPGRRQSVQPIHLPYEGNVLPREGHVLLFYLQGSIKEQPDSLGSPVVSRADYLHTVQIRQATMDTFRNVIATGGTVIYVGYSFADQFLDDLLDEAARRIGNRNMPYGYAILPEWPDKRTGAAAKVSRRFITPVEGTFEGFAELIHKVASEEPREPKRRATVSSPAVGKTLALSTGTAKLGERDAGVQSEYFELLTDERTREEPLDPEEERRLARAFLKGETRGWTPFVRKWAFERSSYPDVLEAIRQASEREQHGHDRIVLVHGPAGLGKSVMAHQLALELYKRDGYLVLLPKPVWRARPDVAALNRVLDDVENGLPDTSELPPIVLIIDEAELLEHTVPLRVVRQAQTAGRTMVVVLLARTNEYFRIGTEGARPVPEKWGDPVLVPLSERITEGEVKSLISHVKRLRLWADNRLTDERFWIGYSERELGGSFFDTLYSLVDDTKQPLEERIWSEYERLGNVAQDAYLLIAATHQFGLPLKMEMLVRALGVSFAEFEAQVIRSDAREVLFSEYDTNELNIFYRGRTRLISGIVFGRALPEMEQQHAMFLRVLGAATGSSMFGTEETDLVRNLLVQVLGPSGFDRRFSPDQQASLFEIATRTIEDDVLEHHYGLIEKEAGRLESAKAHLEKALQLSATSLTPRESPQNIENSLGQVLGDLAFEALRSSEGELAERLFGEAAGRFIAARRGEFPNAAAYDAHARMLVRRAKAMFAEGSTERAVALAGALDVVSAGLDNVSDGFRGELQELRAGILTSVGLGEVAIDDLSKIAEGLPAKERARYEVMIARLLIERVGSDRTRALRRALPHAATATESDPEYFDAWRLRAEIYGRLHPKDFATTRDLLERALGTPAGRENNWILYELAVTYFYLEEFALSAQTFAQLRRVSRGNAGGSTIVEHAGQRTGDEPFEFEGRVVQRVGGTTASIECPELSAFGQIWFNPRRQRAYDARLYDRVSFEVGFNYRGVQAVELRKV